ncbi:MAG: class I SAM-dependent methyltransferase [Janthinobacterium lividum]
MSAIVGKLHSSLVFGRRVRVLADRIAALLPAGASVLDVGCGDGSIASLIMSLRPDVTIRGVDVLVRPETRIPVEEFDGIHLPAADKSFDVVMFIDVLHHTDDAAVSLAEAKRVARSLVLLKDHTANAPLGYARLRFMDWVGNAHHNVVLPYNYLKADEWRAVFKRLDLEVTSWESDVQLYSAPASLLFGHGLHCIVSLDVGGG